MAKEDFHMHDFELMRSLHKKNDTKIILLVMDGLGGLPIEPGGPTELEAANTPNLDRLAAEGTLGQTVPVRRGITPGSGPAHLGLFGYDPVEFEVGRGVLEATGIGMTVSKGHVAVRGNFCTVDAEGKIIDRRAGRIPSDEAIPIVNELQEIEIEGVDVDVRPVREYRFAAVMSGKGLSANIEDTDPQQTGVAPLPARALDGESEACARYFNQWIAAAREKLQSQPKANALTLRGFSTDPGLPQFPEIFGLRAGCIAVYPMYRGVSKLVGMELIEFEGETPEQEFLVASQRWNDYDFFFIHIKKTDSKGEDGNFEGKVKIIESVDAALPQLMDLNPDVVLVTGDHSTPAKMRSHSWHPVPALLWAPETVRADAETTFGERACGRGGFGTIPATALMPLMMAHANRLEKFGA
jgi:2,3-bisphosphoglycerate-independent phosphoglycerate mutase